MITELPGAAPLEIEIKTAVPADRFPALRQRLRDIGFTLAAPRAFEKNILFDDADNRLKAARQVLRLRHTHGQNILTFKRPVPHAPSAYKIREELETGVENFDTMRRIIEGLGFTPRFAYEKFRETFVREQAHVLLDETPIGGFVEIEAAAGDIDRIASELGFPPETWITDNYLTLFKKAGGTGDMLFPPHPAGS